MGLNWRLKTQRWSYKHGHGGRGRINDIIGPWLASGLSAAQRD